MQLDALIAARESYVVRARVHICMVCLESIFWLRRHHPFICSFKNGGEIPSKRNILYNIIMRRDLEKVDIALLQSSFE